MKNSALETTNKQEKFGKYPWKKVKNKPDNANDIRSFDVVELSRIKIIKKLGIRF